MKQFNYQDYLQYQNYYQKGLREETEKYKYEKNRVNHPHDKIFRLALDDKEQMTNLINKIVPIKPQLKKEEIEKYNSSFINSKFENQESDVIYKLKNQKVFFLVEHQTKIDYSMPKRILEYEVEIIKSALDEPIRRNSKLPMVIPIVIYTGNRKWNVKRYMEECQEKLRGVEKIKLGEYYLLDVNDYTKEELLKEKSFLYKILALEKCKEEEEIFNILLTIVEEEQIEENIKLLQRMIYYIFREKIGEEKTKILLEKLVKGGEDMILEVIRKENEKLIKKGKIEGVETVTIEMIKNNIDDEMIMKLTKIKKQELDKLKNRIRT